MEKDIWKLEDTIKCSDSSIRTPAHDKLCLWVHDNIDIILSKVFNNEFLQKYEGTYSVFMETPLLNKGYVVGIPDFTINFYRKDSNNNTYVSHVLYIEAKPRISSLGNTLRQLQIYHEYGLPSRDRHNILLVTKGSKFKKII